ncbi:MAG TPA: 30S ribosomal protein S18 [Planctomycetes bacterium]|nr:30S ribosomal protein S18 [Planctomycetota bacterium]
MARGNGGKRRGNDIHFIDFKDSGGLRRFLSANGKIYSRKRLQTSSKAQRLVGQAVKRARYMGLLSYTN